MYRYRVILVRLTCTRATKTLEKQLTTLRSCIIAFEGPIDNTCKVEITAAFNIPGTNAGVKIG